MDARWRIDKLLFLEDMINFFTVCILSEKIKLFMFNTLVPLCLCFVAGFCNFINCLVSFIIGEKRRQFLWQQSVEVCIYESFFYDNCKIY